jgi:hypothetical protein
MMRTRTVRSLALAAAALALTSLGVPFPAEAHGRHGGARVGVAVGGFYGWGPYWGWGAPYWGWGPGPFGFGAPGDAALGYAMMSGMGGLDMSGSPKQAEVWVEGKYVAEAREVDGNPSYLWLEKGPHHIVVYKAGFRSLEEDVEVNVGMIRELKVKLEPGDSAPPVRAAADVRPESARPESPRDESTVPRAEATETSTGTDGGVRLRVEPRDATVYVDDTYRGTARDLPSLRLPAGHHRVQLVRPGFRPLEKEFDVEASRTIDLEISMEKGGGWKY